VKNGSNVLNGLRRQFGRWLDNRRLPVHVKNRCWTIEPASDRNDPGPQAIIAAGIDWLLRAQDCSVSKDGGVARHYD